MVVDQTKELTNEFIREQLSDYSDLLAPLDMAPPTLQLMQWKENGGADKLFTQPCSLVVAPQIKEVKKKNSRKLFFFNHKNNQSINSEHYNEITKAAVKSDFASVALCQEYFPDQTLWCV